MPNTRELLLVPFRHCYVFYRDCLVQNNYSSKFPKTIYTWIFIRILETCNLDNRHDELCICTISVMYIFIVRGIQQLKVKQKFALIVLTKQVIGEVSTHIMPFIKPHSNERLNSSKLLDYTVVIVMEYANRKMSRETNKWVMMQWIAVTAILFTGVGPPPKPNQTVVDVPETPLKTYHSIM